GHGRRADLHAPVRRVLKPRAAHIPLRIAQEDGVPALVQKPAGNVLGRGAGAPERGRSRGTLGSGRRHRFGQRPGVGGELRPAPGARARGARWWTSRSATAGWGFRRSSWRRSSTRSSPRARWAPGSACRSRCRSCARWEGRSPPRTTRVAAPRCASRSRCRPSRPVRPRSSGRLMKLSVLVVDDELLIRKSLAKVMRARGYAVELASSGAEGLQKVTEARPQVMILDMRLPDTDGLSVLCQVREIDPLLQVIVITAFRDVKWAVAAVKL